MINYIEKKVNFIKCLNVPGGRNATKDVAVMLSSWRQRYIDLELIVFRE